MAWSNRATFKSLMAVISVSSLCLLSISQFTHFWIHFKETSLTGKDISYKYGLWQTCRFEEEKKVTCFSSEKVIDSLKTIESTQIKIWLLVSIGLQIISIILLFRIILKQKYMYHLFILCLIAMIQSVTSVVGVSLFARKVADINLQNFSYGWSFVICCVGAVLNGLLLILSTLLYLIKYRNYKRSASYYFKNNLKEKPTVGIFVGNANKWQNDDTMSSAPVHSDNGHGRSNLENNQVIENSNLSTFMPVENTEKTWINETFTAVAEKSEPKRKTVTFNVTESNLQPPVTVYANSREATTSQKKRQNLSTLVSISVTATEKGREQ